MRLRSIVSEAVRNISAGTARAAWFFLIVLITGLLLGGYEATSIVRLEQEAVTRIAADADTKALVGAGVDGVACDALTQVDNGPTLSGAARATDSITAASTPGMELPAYEVTPGFIPLLVSSGEDAASSANDSGSQASSTSGTNGTVDTSGIWVSADVSRDFGLVKGSIMQTNHGDMTVAGVYSWPNDGRDSRFAYAAIVPVSASSGTFTECWAKQWPVTEQTDELLRSTAIVTASDGNTAVAQVNKSFDSRYDAASGYAHRMSAWLPYVALGVGIIVGVISVRRRRLEYAGALHIGQSKAAQMLGMHIETLIWSGLASLACVALLCAYCWRMSVDGWLEIFLAACRVPAMTFAGVTVATFLAGICVRESQLLRFFKSR
ncbi:hypothetical protein KIH75_08860 [Bifidobacterium sp. 64T4]|uniref:hypothetical protein n=1 Tax=Bifidobacterium pongonis TaxID=2834432 RepID=UPI001C59CDD4|nr:hypothetical protein [Bifidobacterium pongonis]MBW3095434.1 hypothetical protein [Bifidobacterium pongonis]